MASSGSFDQLSYGVQRWIYRQGWKGLRAIQEVSVPIVLAAEQDILITAPTAGGKTEAAFLPIISFLEEQGEGEGYGALCLSPLKALINDQFQRLEPLCESAMTRITPWHGDVSQSIKQKSWKNPQGLLMITPESLEAMFIRRPHELAPRIRNLKYIVIDEFHAFIGRERGQQLLSLLARIEAMIGRRVCRVALSATIGDPDMALSCLRPDMSRAGVHLDVEHEKMSLKLLLKAYPEIDPETGEETAFEQKIQDLYGWLRGSNHLVFANSRQTVESVADGLTMLCEANHVPNEFFAHHGSLSRDARHYVEHRLKAGDKPTTAVATSTLELGVDIGDVVSVAQVGAPGNVSSIRQRLGRSGRREGQSAILRVLVTSRANSREPSPLDLLEVELVQAAAVIELMLERWVEPPDIGDWHLSTLVQQVLSMIAYSGGQKAGTLYEILCRKGPWQWVPPELFARMLKGMGEADYIQQLPDGDLIVGVAGERITSGRDIYSAFETPEYFRVVVGGKELGVLPIDSPLMKDQMIIFAGRRWQVEDIDPVGKVIVVKPAKGGKPPQFSGEPAQVHRRVREKMHEMYRRSDVPLYMEEETAGLLSGARGYFRMQDLGGQPYVQMFSAGYWFVWAEDRVISTLLLALKQQAIDVDQVGPCIEVMPAIHWDDLVGMAREGVEVLAAGKLKKISLPYALGKFDDSLPEDLLSDAFKSSRVDLERALDYLSSITGSVRYSAP